MVSRGVEGFAMAEMLQSERQEAAGGQHARDQHPHEAHAHAAPDAGAVDPVCGMTVDPHATAHRYSHHGRTYYFCSAGCREKFAADPAKYLGADAAAPPAAPVPEGTIYTCPM